MLKELIGKRVHVVQPGNPVPTVQTVTLLEFAPDKGYIFVEHILGEGETLAEGEPLSKTIFPWHTIIAITQANITVNVPVSPGQRTPGGIHLPPKNGGRPN